MRPALAAAISSAGYAPWKVTGNVLSYEADRAVVLDSNEVDSWSDVSGRLGGKPLVPPAGQAAATYIADDGDGRPAIRVSGVDQGLENTTWGAIDLDADFTAAFVTRQTTAADSISICYGDHADNLGRLILRPFSPSLEVGMFSSTTVNVDNARAIATTAWQFTYVRRSGATFYVTTDANAEQGAAIPAGAFNQQKLFVGFARASGAFALPFTGRFRAMAFFSRSLSAAELAALRTFWKAKWPGLP